MNQDQAFIIPTILEANRWSKVVHQGLMPRPLNSLAEGLGTMGIGRCNPKNVLGAFRTIQVQHYAVVKWIQMAAMHSDQ